MRAIFTYPNNPSTYYIDPDYVGNPDYGFEKRIIDLHDGTYLDWGTATPPTKTPQQLMEQIGKYYHYYDTVGSPNITRHDMWTYPLVELELELIPATEIESFEIVSSYPTLNSNNKPFPVYKFTTVSDHKFDDMTHIVCPGGNDVPKVGTTPQANFAEGYAKRISATEFEVYGDTNLDTTVGSDFQPVATSVDEVYIWNNELSTSNAYGAPQMGLQMPNGTSLLADGDALRRTEDLDNSNWTGNGANNVIRYVDVVDSNHVNLYEDASRTIPLTVTPEFVNDGGGPSGSHVFGYGSGPQLKELSTIAYVGDQETRFKALSCYNQSGQQRIKGYVTVYSEDTSGDTGPLVFSNVDPLIAIGDMQGTTSTYNSPRYQKVVWIEVANAAYTLYPTETGGNPISFEGRCDSGEAVNGQTAYWDVHVIEPALNQSPNSCTVDEHTWFKYESGSLTGGDEFWDWYRRVEVEGNSTSNLDVRYQYKKPDLIIPGTNTYKHIIPNPINILNPLTVNGAQFGDYAIIPGGQGSVLRSSLEGTEYEAAVFTFTQNTEGQVTDISATTPGVYMPQSGSSPFIWQNHVDPLPNTYVPPAPLPWEIAAAEDNFDTNDEWDTNPTGYDYSRVKNWPLSPVPKSAELTETTPSVTTNSQNGIKYVRSGGFTKWGVELTYPPLTEEEFRVLQVTSQLAKGQKAVFRWYWTTTTSPTSEQINTGSGEWIWKRNFTSNRVPFVLQWRDNEKVLKVEGFESNESEVVKAGQIVSVGSSYNGENSQAMSTTDANIYGEAEFRINFKTGNWFLQPGSYTWLTINHFAVTLAEDDFVYKQRADGLYEVSVRFDLDWYHAS